MLTRLHISNYVLIDEVKIDFDKGLSVITGETGSGKSILLDAIGLLMGNRADSSAITNKDKKTVVEGIFEISAYGLEPFFTENDLDFEAQSILRREINPAGKSRAFINDTPVTLQQLKELAEKLIDIHTQHQNLHLSEPNFFYQMLSTAEKFHEKERFYRRLFSQWQAARKKLRDAIEAQKKMSAEQDYIRFQVEELNQAQIKLHEEVELEAQFEALSHAEEISRQLFHIQNLMQESDFAVLTNLKEIANAFQSIIKYAKQLEPLFERFQSSIIEMRDIAEELASKADTFQPDQEALRKVEERLDLLQSLMQKHRVSNSGELLKVKQNFEEQIQALDESSTEIQKLETETRALEERLTEMAEDLFQERQKAIPKICQNIKHLLQKLQMPDAELCILHERIGLLHSFGNDQLQVLFSANKGIKPERIEKIASGGEVSRLMLAIKKILAGERELPTMIFDEIDTGVSGIVADAMGEILHEMGKTTQVLAITHLPQVAAKGQNHFKVMKVKHRQAVNTTIVKLTAEERIREIASMLSGKSLTEAAMVNARSLLSAS